LTSPNLELEFHIHTNASHLAIWAILTHNPISKFDQLVMYTSKLLNWIERNYITINIEALVMVYALQNFKQYLLNNRFVFYVDHMALAYLLNKPQAFGRIIKWVLLFLEYDFKIVYKFSRSHLMVNALSRLPNKTKQLVYLIKPLMFTYSPYIYSGYKMFMIIWLKGWCQKDLQLPKS
jgi:hypothetical protein